ncbi:YozE family protein [Peribacillus kribbensis]|uniref:YozE family protein n=1 Tax=Peribacillus kribbensis TaxID=356658 RepID=UPI000429BF69|nr:YozE family protein [Peribacillus kribbensis]
MKSFYHYLMRYRQPKDLDEITSFANAAYKDHGFPKQSADYHEISTYLEMNVQYLNNMAIFDQAWDLYLQDES